MNKPFQRWALATATGLTLAATTLGASATSATELTGVSVRSGGVSSDEYAALSSQAADYSLKLILAAKHTGAYLADVDVVVRSLPSREVVLEHRTEGPLLLATLPPGRYEITATYGQVTPGTPTTQTRIVNINGAGLAQMVMYFDTGDKLSPDLHAGAQMR